MRQQARGRDALVNDMGWNRRLYDRFTRAADPLAAHMLLDLERTGHVVELLGDILADALHLAAAFTHRVVRFVRDPYPRQIQRQVGANRDFLGQRRFPLLIQLDGDRAQILVDRLLESTALLPVELLACTPKSPALED